MRNYLHKEDEASKEAYLRYSALFKVCSHKKQYGISANSQGDLRLLGALA